MVGATTTVNAVIFPLQEAFSADARKTSISCRGGGSRLSSRRHSVRTDGSLLEHCLTGSPSAPYGQVAQQTNGLAIAGIIVGFGWVALLVLTIALGATDSNNGNSGVVNPAILWGQLAPGHLST